MKRNGLLPPEQFATVGSSITMCIAYLLNRLHWVRGQKGLKGMRVSLDITGAFDRVPRQKLLEELAKLGLSMWLVIREFLCLLS